MRFGWLMVVVGASWPACEPHRSAGTGYIPVDATFEAPPARRVVDGGIVFDFGGSGGGGGGGAGGQGGRSEDARVPGPEAQPPGRDAGGDPRAPDSGRAACDLVRQDCPRGQACYPGGAEGTCQPEGGTGVGGQCVEHGECDRGLVCVPVLGAGGSFCRPICDLQSGGCLGGGRCAPLTGRAGYCAP